MSYRVVDAGDLELARGTTRLLRRALGIQPFAEGLDVLAVGAPADHARGGWDTL
ncbi:MAG TPA: hypothetical protein VF963_06750 [Gaiellaceae bacterium]